MEEDENNCVVGVARTEGVLKVLAGEFSSKRVSFVEGDVSEESTSKLAVATAIRVFGQLDSVIANAGLLGPVLSIAKLDVEEWKQTFDINLYAVVHLVQHALPHLKKSGAGRIVAVSSGAATKPYSGWYAYGSSKAALNHFILTLADNEDQISAISVAPGVVETEMQEEIRTVHAPNMDAAGAQRFIDLFKNKELASPQEPGRVFVKLVQQGWGSDLNGKFVRYNNESLRSYQ